MEGDLAGEALAEYDAGTYEQVVEELTLPVSDSPSLVVYNTIFYKPPIKINSWDFFRTIRESSGQNLYLHVPFCRSDCLYCSYEKVLAPPETLIDRYLRAISHEVERKASILKSQFAPDIHYIGGGTPTVLTERSTRTLLQILSRCFDLRNNLEFTIETTPTAVLESDGPDKFHFLKSEGVNRVNVGVQSFDPTVARRNGRQQTKPDIFRCFEILDGIGFDKINLDLIYGLPGQSLEHWAKDLESATLLSPDSITTFSLRVKPPSRLFTLTRDGKIQLPTENDLVVMRIMTRQLLSDHGYQEDIPDYFIKSADKRYRYHPFQPQNLFRNLIGFGPSAYSLAGGTQVFNVRDTEEYLRQSEAGADPVDSAICLHLEEYARKRLAVGLQTVFDDILFEQECGSSIRELLPKTLEKLRGLNLIEIEGERMHLSSQGRILHNRIAEFIKYSPIDSQYIKV